ISVGVSRTSPGANASRMRMTLPVTVGGVCPDVVMTAAYDERSGHPYGGLRHVPPGVPVAPGERVEAARQLPPGERVARGVADVDADRVHLPDLHQGAVP